MPPSCRQIPMTNHGPIRKSGRTVDGRKIVQQDSSSRVMSTTKSTVEIATYYRLFFLTAEPISAVIGAYFAYFQPLVYLRLTHASSAPESDLPLGTEIALAQLSNLYLLFAINEALVLRTTGNLQVWRALLFGLLVADLGHLWSVNRLGVSIYWNILKWNAIDWGNIGWVYVGALSRISFLFGMGVVERKAYQD